MMAAGREAIERARTRGITDSKILSEIGSGAADAVDILKSGKKLIAGSDEWLRVRAYYSDAAQAIRDANKGINNLGGNVSVTEILVDGRQLNINACSNPRNIDGFAELRGLQNAQTDPQRLFKTEFVDSQGNIYDEFIEGVNWNRSVDAEARTLEQLARELGATKLPDGTINWGNINAQGTINLFTENPCCPSCLKVIEQFSSKYKNITINVFWN